MEMPSKWSAKDWGESMDNYIWMKSEEKQKSGGVSSQVSSLDYLVDLYHYKEIARLFSLEDIKKLKDEFSNLDPKESGLNLEEFILLVLKVLEIDTSKHLPFLINGIRELYEIITRKYHRIKVLE
jgi:hypothetical protein